MQLGAMEASIRGCRRPKRLEKLSENAPTIGSDIASKTSDIAMTTAARVADMPSTWE